MKSTFFVAAVFACQFVFAQNKIIIEAEIPEGYAGDSIPLNYLFIDRIANSYVDESGVVKAMPERNLVKWVIHVAKPIIISSNLIDKNNVWFSEADDSIHIKFNGQSIEFSGRGVKKFQLLNQLNNAFKISESSSLYKSLLATKYIQTASLNEYLGWNNYLNGLQRTVLPVIDSYKRKISKTAYNWIRAETIIEIEKQRLSKFYGMMLYCIYENAGEEPAKFKLTSAALQKILDSTVNNPAAKWVRQYAKFGTPGYFWSLNQIESVKNEGFILTDNFKDREKRHIMLYKNARTGFTGVIREKLLAEVLAIAIQRIGFIPDIEQILNDYYSGQSSPDYKEWIKKFEIITRERRLGAGREAPDFILEDSKGNSFSKDRLKGKITIIDFWFTGCRGCMEMTPGMKEVEEKFKSDSNVVFLSISIDQKKDRWLKSISEKRYTTGSAINLYTQGKGKDHPAITSYNVTGYPTLYLIDAYGRVVKNPTPDPRTEYGKEKLIELIHKQLSLLKDGPYVLKEGENLVAYTFYNSTSSSTRVGESLIVQTDDHQTFSVVLKEELKIEADEYSRPQRLLVLSDIEGNFDALRKLLQSNKIIDKDYNWTFGNGHLVFNGDMFDRGSQVTECLWLIYSLEEKAKTAGGYVHFILGNHEIMNLCGDDRYAEKKYKNNAAQLGKSFRDLYDKNSELGKWLRTKNIIERIGDILFVHGGMSKEFSDSVTISVSEINQIARKYIGERVNERTHPDRIVRFIFSSSYSPFWFRQYYDDRDKKVQLPDDPLIKWIVEKPDDEEMNVILKKWGVSRIITGHTIVADTVSLWYGGKVINTDTKHATGKSEALLIEGGRFYRVNAEGRRVLLFIEEKKNTVTIR